MKRLNAAMIWDSHHVPLEIRLFPRSNCLQSAPNPAFPRARGKEQAASARRKDRSLLRLRGKEQAASARRKDRPLLRVRGKEQAASAQRKDRSLLRMRGREQAASARRKDCPLLRVRGKEQAASAQRKDCSLLRLRGRVGVGVCCDGDWPPTNVASALRRSRCAERPPRAARQKKPSCASSASRVTAMGRARACLRTGQ